MSLDESCYVVLPCASKNAGLKGDTASWLHGYCMNFVVGESRGTKPFFFLGKVASPGDERYLVCGTGAGLLLDVC